MMYLWARKLPNKAILRLFEKRIIYKQVVKELTPSILFILEIEIISVIKDLVRLTGAKLSGKDLG